MDTPGAPQNAVTLIGPRPPAWQDFVREFWPYGILIVVLILLGYLAWRKWKKRVPKAVEASPIMVPVSAPPLDPRDAWALLAVPEVEDRQKWLAFLFDVSLTLRNLLGQRFLPGAPHMTTDELVRWLETQKRDMAFSRPLIAVLRELDAARYAPRELTRDSVRALFGQVQPIAQHLLADPTDVTYVSQMGKLPDAKF